MELSNKYFEDEVRSGFYVPSLMKKFWAVQMKVLAQIDDICTRHGIQWFADCGTLLGAVRHNGAIPWDDDFDIAMKREDFNRFTEIAIKEIKEPYYVMSSKVNGYWEVMTRITNGQQINYAHEHLKEFYGCPFPTGIDIFPLDCVPPEEDAQLVIDIMNIIFKLINETGPMFKEYDEDGPLYGNTNVPEEYIADIDRKCTLLENMTHMKIDRNKPIRMQLMNIVETVQSMYREDESKYVAILSIWMDNQKNKSLLKYYDGNIVNIPFEEGTIRVPAVYDAILKSKYGDYMKPVRDWNFHQYPLYDEQYKTMVEAGVGPRRYAFNAANLENPQRELARKPRQRAESFFKMLPTMISEVMKIANAGNAQTACEMLMKIQEGVINVGNMLEETEGEGFAAIPVLENYCEHIFALFSAISAGAMNAETDVNAEEAISGAKSTEANACTDAATIGVKNPADGEDILVREEQLLRDLALGALQEVSKNSKDKREVVFLVSRLEAWPYMESVWKAECERGDTNVVVIPLQFIYKDWIGKAKEICFETNRLPAYVELTEVDSYDFVKRHPDVIYTHDHFEGENDMVTIHPAMYSSNIKKFTEEVVYIPAFIVDEYNSQDGRACRMMQEYVNMPGIVHADTVYVRSDKTREGYIETLVNWAGEETRDIWEKKIVVNTLPFVDVEKRKIYEIPKAWEPYILKPDGKRKKVVMFSNGTSTLLEHGYEMIDKIRRVLDTFRAVKDDVVLVWRPHPMLREALIGEAPEVWEAFSELVREYQDENWGILDLGENLDTVVGISDAYYGDTGSIPQKFSELKKPVMLLAVEV